MKSACDLLAARKELQTKLYFKAKRTLFVKQGFFYKHGNKSSKFLAQPIRDTQSSTHILQVKSRDNQLVHTIQQIASEFHHFYSKLYNLLPSHKPSTFEDTRPQII